ncbi:PQQ-binding-like beta-propeller repeat protein [Haloarchaeobius sp. HRN-SO-5]|uniref:outer membrane protein assembly factor BamB family protein n=1 Tax=Haloarchaeobius sp. HRN-SO-5 TaxID=3446118 RepID=UPI003EB6BDCE
MAVDRRTMLRLTGAGIVGRTSLPNTVVGAELTGGDELWRFEIGNRIYSSPAVADGTVFVGSLDTNLYAVDAETGEEQWRFETDTQIDSSPTVVDGTVFVGGVDTNLYAVDAGTGDVQWRFVTDDRIESTPTVADGTVFVGSFNGNLYALDVDGDGSPRSDDGILDFGVPGILAGVGAVGGLSIAARYLLDRRR